MLVLNFHRLFVLDLFDAYSQSSVLLILNLIYSYTFQWCAYFYKAYSESIHTSFPLPFDGYFKFLRAYLKLLQCNTVDYMRYTLK